jgi:hypothetical protein
VRYFTVYFGPENSVGIFLYRFKAIKNVVNFGGLTPTNAWQFLATQA